MIAALFTLAFIGVAFYWLFIKGTIWGILLCIFGVVGGRLLILQWFPQTQATIMTFMQNDISWATFIAAIVSVLGVGYVMGQAE